MKDLKSIFKKIFITPEKECCCKVKIAREKNDKKRKFQQIFGHPEN